LFRDSWGDSFTAKNIKKAFEATGIWPLQPLTTIKKLQKPSHTSSTPSKLPPLFTKTPQTVRSIRQLIKSSPSRQKEALLERAVLRLATKFDIQSFENRGLRTAITQEKKRRQRNKRLNLLGEQDDSVPQFFSLRRVLAAKAFQEGKEEAKEKNKRQKAIRREEAAYKRQEILAEKQERAIQRQLRQIATQEDKAAEKAQKALKKEEKRHQKEQDKQQKATLALERKKAQELRRELVVAAKKTMASKPRPKRLSASPLKARKARIISAIRVTKPIRGSQGRD
jgi:hypothetical protein